MQCKMTAMDLHLSMKWLHHFHKFAAWGWAVCPCVHYWTLMATLCQISEIQTDLRFSRGRFPQAAAASPCPRMPPASLTGCHLVRKLHMDFSTSAHVTALSNAKCV